MVTSSTIWIYTSNWHSTLKKLATYVTKEKIKNMSFQLSSFLTATLLHLVAYTMLAKLMYIVYYQTDNTQMYGIFKARCTSGKQLKFRLSLFGFPDYHLPDF